MKRKDEIFFLILKLHLTLYLALKSRRVIGKDVAINGQKMFYDHVFTVIYSIFLCNRR